MNNDNKLADQVRLDLLPNLSLSSDHPDHPVVVTRYPAPWRLLGAGNYAAVFWHPEHSDFVAKVYAPGRPGLADEAEVYRRLGVHPAFSNCLAQETQFLILKRLDGITFWDALQQAVVIPDQAITDIDAALEHARSKGLNPHDIHGKNLMVTASGHGLVVDVSDFLKPERCMTWDNLKRAYRWLYAPILRPLRIRVPLWGLELIRNLYRLTRRLIRQPNAYRPKTTP